MKLYGDQMRTYIDFSLTTWGRLAEVTKLEWADVGFDNHEVYFRSTKSHEDRFVPVEDTNILATLRRLQAKTLQDGGPFVAYQDKSNLAKKWDRVVEDAGIPAVTRHDLRRTGITRALLAGMPPVAVQRIAGHAKITTTMDYYVEVEKQDLRDAMKRLAAG